VASIDPLRQDIGASPFDGGAPISPLDGYGVAARTPSTAPWSSTPPEAAAARSSRSTRNGKATRSERPAELPILVPTTALETVDLGGAPTPSRSLARAATTMRAAIPFCSRSKRRPWRRDGPAARDSYGCIVGTPTLVHRRASDAAAPEPRPRLGAPRILKYLNHYPARRPGSPAPEASALATPKSDMRPCGVFVWSFVATSLCTPSLQLPDDLQGRRRRRARSHGLGVLRPRLHRALHEYAAA